MVDDIRKTLNIEVPKRAQYLRVIIMELARITDHLICNSFLVLIQVPILDFYMFFNLERYMKSMKKFVVPV
jgi:NADH:ubiquinone oxidoreductase subunit D